MDTVKLKVLLLDKADIFERKAEYNPQTRLATERKGFRKTVVARYFVNPSHIGDFYHGRKSEKVVLVDVAKRRSVTIEEIKNIEIKENGKTRKEKKKIKEKVKTDGVSVKFDSDVIDEKLKTKLDFHVERQFWQALMRGVRMPLSKFLIIFFSGMGAWHFIRLILMALGMID